MTSRDDSDDSDGRDDSEDPKLRQLRAVWVSMRDEAPPDRGLAALMAAAREQAEAMKPTTSWWHRVLAALRRPPVLALATVVVLIGGTIVITQRGDSMKSESTSTSDHVEWPGSAVTSQAPLSVPPAPEVTGAAEGDTPSSGAIAPAQSQEAAPQPEPPRLRSQPERKVATPSPPHASAPKPPPPPAVRQSPGVAEGELRDFETTSPVGVVSGLSAQPPASPADDGVVRATPDARQSTSVEQMIKQCETAAARGDCEAVRALAERIAKSAPGAYKDRVVKNASVARCLK